MEEPREDCCGFIKINWESDVCFDFPLDLILSKDLTRVQHRGSVLRDETGDLHNEGSGCEGRDNSGDSAGVDQSQKDQTS